MSDKRRNEWALILFTLGLQISCGMTVAITALDLYGSNRSPEVQYVRLLILPVSMLALAASIFHLGRPLFAWRVVLNVSSSRLTQEVVCTSVFTLLTIILSVSSWKSPEHVFPVLDVVTAAAGVLAVGSSVRIYTVPPRPFWRSWWLKLSFFASIFLIAGILGMYLAARKAVAPALCLGLEVMMFASAALVISAIGMLRRFNQIARMSYSSPYSRMGLDKLQWMIWSGFLLFAGLLPLSCGVVLNLGFALKIETVGVLLVLIFLGLALGRVLMFSLGDSISNF